MKMDKVAGSGNDEFYTPLYAVKPIFKYLKPGARIWCPFDTEDSLFVRYGRQQGFKVIASHIDNGKDFFKVWLKKQPDYIISNPPYSEKQRVLQRLFKHDVPFAMLMGVVGLFESQARFEMFRDNEFETMYFNKRISYFQDYNEPKPSKHPPFSSIYVCHNILPDKYVFEEINTKEYTL